MKSALTALSRAFWKDEHGFIVSAELVLVGTIAVLSMVVGLSTVSRAINNELSDIANAFSAVNQDNGSTGGRSASVGDAGIVRR